VLGSYERAGAITPGRKEVVSMRLSPLLIIHICGGSAGLLAGTIAMVVRKGGRWHRVAG
jgi:hypothetical protein